MGQQHNNAALARPLGLAGADELVNNALRRVGEIPELRLPDHQGIGVGHGVAQFKAQHAVLGERAVADRVLCLVRAQAVQRDVNLKEKYASYNNAKLQSAVFKLLCDIYEAL
jgi:hypothetical protein